MDTKGLQKEFINWCKSKNKLPKSEDETKQLFVAFMKEKHPEEYKKAVENQQKQQQAQTQKALHGAKLNYFRILKNQCAEDEEVVYYKKGGSVTCGCKKKEQGGEVPSAKDGAVAKFKNRKNIPAPQQQINPNDTIHVNGQIKSLTDKPIKDKNNTYKPLTPEEYKKLKDKDKNRVDEKDATRGRQVHKCGGKVKKGEDGLLPIKNPKGKPSKNINRGGTKSKLPVQSKGSKINKDCGGSAIAKFKALRNGGSLNRIPFYLGGTSKEGVLRSIYKNPQINYYELSTGTNPMWYRFAYPNQNYILSDNDLGKPGEGVVFISDERVPGSYLGGTNGGWDPTKRKRRFNTPKTFIGSLYNTWETFADSIRNANGFKPAQNRKVKVKK